MMSERKRLNNTGMSLVELLIAIVILAVIVVPLLHAFVTSSRVNAKAKSKLRQTVVAQDVMEGLKAYSVEDLVYQFNYPNIRLAEYSLSFNIVNPNLIEGGKSNLLSHVMELEEITGNKFVDKDHSADISKWSIENFDMSSRNDNTKTHSFQQRESGKYYFALKNITLADTSVSDNSYMKNSYVDILIEADAGQYKDAPGDPHVKSNYNSADFVNIPVMDSYVDAFYVENSSNATNEEVAKFFKNKYSSDIGTLPIDEIIPKMKKKIKISVKETTGATKNGNDRYEVLVESTYFLDGDSARSKSITNQIYDNYATDEKPKNVYLFYEPIYHTGDYATMKDEIIYDTTNGGAALTSFYIVKQGTLSATQTQWNGYNCSISIIPADTSAVTAIKTNLGHDLTTGDILTDAWSNNVFTGCGTVDGTGKPDKVLPLKGEEKKDRIYGCKVYIFEKGTIDKWLGGTPYSDLNKEALTVIEGNMK